ncbi:hypothetical protein TNCV_4189161 [Trichonephila clavipes]|nr:hypothetical protein TNCV_4189161 [Trichonephila clavipes]
MLICRLHPAYYHPSELVGRIRQHLVKFLTSLPSQRFDLSPTVQQSACDGTFIAFSVKSPLGVLFGQNGNSFQPTREEERDYANLESYI